jgi:polysaccharide biosynthesis/export protein
MAKALLLCGLMALAAYAQTGANSAPGGNTASDSGQLSAANNTTYVIGPEDTLHIAVWKEPDLTATLPVRPDGKISMPLLNDVQASGLTPMQLADSITDKLKKYVTDPRVTVVVTGMNSQRIYLLGEVTHTGAMALTPNMTILQALSAAGFTQFANTKHIYVLRQENGKQQKIPVNYKQLIKGDAQNISLKPGDTVVVP